MPIQLHGIHPGSTLGETRKAIELALTLVYGGGEARYMATLIMEVATGLPRTKLIANANDPLDPPQYLPLASMVNRVEKGEPLQYVLGFVDWGNLRLKVGYGALIPRPETEWILSRIVDETKDIANPWLLDICTGTGCVPLGYKYARPDAHVAGLDVSGPALRWAYENRKQLDMPVDLYKVDVLKDDFPAELLVQVGSWQIIVSNPPYVPQAEMADMAVHVKEHEPDLALFVPDQDPLLFYRRISSLAIQWLAPGGILFLEAHTDRTEAVAGLLRMDGFEEIRVEIDPYDRPRLVWAKKATL